MRVGARKHPSTTSDPARDDVSRGGQDSTIHLPKPRRYLTRLISRESAAAYREKDTGARPLLRKSISAARRRSAARARQLINFRGQFVVRARARATSERGCFFLPQFTNFPLEEKKPNLHPSAIDAPRNSRPGNFFANSAKEHRASRDGK